MKIKRQETRDAIHSYNDKVRHEWTKQKIDQYLDNYAIFLTETPLRLEDKEETEIYLEGWAAFRYMSNALYPKNTYYYHKCSTKYIPERFLEMGLYREVEFE